MTAALILAFIAGGGIGGCVGVVVGYHLCRRAVD